MVLFEDEVVEQLLDVAAGGGAVSYTPRWVRPTTPEEAEAEAEAEAEEEKEVVPPAPIVGLRAIVSRHVASVAPPQSELEASVEEWFEAHEARQAAEAAARKAEMEGDGGWTLVTSHKGRKRSREDATATAVGAVSVGRANKMMKMAKKKEVGDFYRFQKRDARREELLRLRESFQKDREKAMALRSSRRFLK